MVVTGENSCPLEVRNEESKTRYDLETHQEEADVIIVQQVLHCVGEVRQIAVVSDDTDVFVLLLHHYQMAGVEVPLTMESPSKERAILNIKVTQAKHRDIVKNLLPAHALSGCDTMACYFDTGKGTVIKILKAGYAPLPEVIAQATCFISACYGMKESQNISHTRLLVWGKKRGKGHPSSPNLAVLPPTREAFIENVKRAHFQAVSWRSIDVNPVLSPEEYGWKRDTANKTLYAPLLYQTTQNWSLTTSWKRSNVAAKLIPPCSTKKCNCMVKALPCTMFCVCFSVGCSRLQ